MNPPRNSCAATAQNTGIPQNIIQHVKEHLFIKEHLISNSDGLFIGRFGKDEYDIALWKFAENGFDNNFNYTDEAGFPSFISPQQGSDDFKKLIYHEYIESKLMEYGMNFRSPHDPSNPSSVYLGAHDLAPAFNNTVPNFERTSTMSYPTNLTDLENLLIFLKNTYKLE